MIHLIQNLLLILERLKSQKFFLNKEYKQLESKVSYIKKNRINLVISVLENVKERFDFTEFIHLPFAVSIDRVETLLSKKNIYKYDFAFTGALHSLYLDQRRKLKELIIPKNKKFLGVIFLIWIRNIKSIGQNGVPKIY